MKVYTKREPKVFVKEKAFHKIKLMCEAAEGEVGAVGTVKKANDGNYIVEDIFIPKQKAHKATCELDPESLLEIATKLPDPNSVRFWVHSHGNMDVYPSEQDEKQLAELSEGCDFFIAGIHQRGMDCHYCIVEGDTIYDDVIMTMMMSEEYENLIKERLRVDAEIERYNQNQIKRYREEIKKDVQENVEKIELVFKKEKVARDDFDKAVMLSYQDNIERYYLRSALDGWVYPHMYFEEELTLDEIFTYEELAGMAMCLSPEDMKKYIEETLRVEHDWSNFELEKIFYEVLEAAKQGDYIC